MLVIPHKTRKKASNCFYNLAESNASQDALSVKPFVKWAGGKGQLLKEIQKIYPAGLGKIYTKYAEPFVGGGAVLFDVLSKHTLQEVYISDVNKELISTYIAIRDALKDLVILLEIFHNEYNELNLEMRKKYYYKKRNLYNFIKINKNKNTEIECAALFIFLNKTCFNGLYRVNINGIFNVPMGTYKNPLIYDSENLHNISQKLQNVHITCSDYRYSESFIDEKTFVYFDPPYRPITRTSNFTAYTEKSFDDNAQIELSEYVNYLSSKGAKIIVSNADPKNSNTKDEFIDRLYANYHIDRVQATRMINSNSMARGKINELLIRNF
ncbi:MAG: Dam family site-specific DNA-(adenine-N6)-methyltransferase [Desulfovibrio sp.]|jgi:DNA adenine methylase|nr:Dam family site-specific DNA-(adenine-N6)-methyltransferase [Desulfovibrio sp.]